jgi:hypothetical protein
MPVKDRIAAVSDKLIQQGASLLQRRMLDNQTTDASNGEGSVHAPGGMEASSAGDLGPAGSGFTMNSFGKKEAENQTTDAANGVAKSIANKNKTKIKPKSVGGPKFGGIG